MAFIEFIDYISEAKTQIITLLLEHIQLTAMAVGLAILIGVPLGILISYVKKLDRPVLGVANVVQAIPSMALLGFAIPFLGIGATPAIVMVVLYSLLPIIKNTYTGIQNINPQMIEAAHGIGLTEFQILTKVQIPLALPVIMAGVRISSVTAVGLMTMAAFIGGGGLGFLVFSGIRTVNNYQILAGAIPACLLALTVDFLCGVVEKLVTPVSLQPAAKSIQEAKKNRSRQKLIIATAVVCVAAIFVTTFFGAAPSAQKSIVVGSKDFTEQQILCHLISEAIEAKTDIQVVRQPNLGGTQVCFGALKSGDIDLYIDYTGTCYGDTLQYPPIPDVEEVYQTVKKDFKEKFGIEVLNQFGFNNTYTLAVEPETAEQYGLSKISDLRRVAGQLTISPTLEFLNRADGLPGLQEKYAFQFKDVIGIDGSPRYTALINGESDVVDAFATDGLLVKFGLTVLEDDQHFFPPYYAVPLMRSEAYEKYPEIVPVLEEVGALLTDEVMSQLNYQVDEEWKQPQDVAHAFLVEHGIVL